MSCKYCPCKGNSSLQSALRKWCAQSVEAVVAIMKQCRQVDKVFFIALPESVVYRCKLVV